MKSIYTALLVIAAIALTSVAPNAQAKVSSDVKLKAMERALTLPTVMVRTGLKPCSKDAQLETLSGGFLEAYYNTKVADLDKKLLTADSWKSLTKNNCTEDCSCSSLSTIYGQYDAETKAKLENTFESKLSAMTDDDYKACRAKIKNFCNHTEIRDFMKGLKASAK